MQIINITGKPEIDMRLAGGNAGVTMPGLHFACGYTGYPKTRFSDSFKAITREKFEPKTENSCTVQTGQVKGRYTN